MLQPCSTPILSLLYIGHAIQMFVRTNYVYIQGWQNPTLVVELFARQALDLFVKLGKTISLL